MKTLERMEAHSLLYALHSDRFRVFHPGFRLWLPFPNMKTQDLHAKYTIEHAQRVIDGVCEAVARPLIHHRVGPKYFPGGKPSPPSARSIAA